VAGLGVFLRKFLGCLWSGFGVSSGYLWDVFGREILLEKDRFLDVLSFWVWKSVFETDIRESCLFARMMLIKRQLNPFFIGKPDISHKSDDLFTCPSSETTPKC